MRGVALILGGLLAGWTALSAWAQPAQVLLLRHAEKPDDPENAHLSQRGQERAMALVPYLAGTPALLKFGPPAALYAARPTARDRSRRALETLLPAAEQWKLQVQTPGGAREYEGVARLLLEDRTLKGKNVVVCWPHEYLAELAAAFGVKPKPAEWKGSVFDRIWSITFTNSQAILTDLPQRLLFGDSKK